MCQDNTIYLDNYQSLLTTIKERLVDAHQIAAIVNHLFTVHRRPDGKEYTNQEVSEQLEGAIHPSTISKIRNAQMADPRRNTLMLLCKFFGESPVIFFPDLAPTTPADDPVAVAMRTTSLGPQQKEKLAEFLRALEEKYRNGD
jgi:transcriptional regulator with XRE-family HTH domain